MARSLAHSRGLTLIEVLIALAIVSIALTAAIKAVSQSVRTMHYLQTKTIAMYVGEQALNEARVGLLKLGPHRTTMFEQEWSWNAESATTANPHVDKIKISVFDQGQSILDLESYVYHE